MLLCDRVTAIQIILNTYTRKDEWKKNGGGVWKQYHNFRMFSPEGIFMYQKAEF